jgi:hypothetical protein
MTSVAFALLLTAPGQCRGGVCSPPAAYSFTDRPYSAAFVNRQAPRAVAPRWDWVPIEDGEEALYTNGVQVGSWKGGTYRPHDAATNSWGPPPGGVAKFAAKASQTAKPRSCQCGPGDACKGGCGDDCRCAAEPMDETAAAVWAAAETPDDPHPGGVDLARIVNDGETYTVNGKRCSKQRAFEAIQAGGTLADDSGRWFVVYVTADKEKRKGFLDRWRTAAELAGEREKCHAQAYSPDDAMAKARGYTAPGFYVVDATGAKLDGPLAEAPDAATLADLLRRLRNPDVPLIQPVIKPTLNVNLPPWALWLIGGGLVLLLLKKKEA